MNISFCINKNINFCNESFKDFLDKDPKIPLCQREYIQERVNEFYDYIKKYQENSDDKINLSPYLGIIHCGRLNNELYILDGQHRFFAYKKFFEENNTTKIYFPYILRNCDTKDELKQYFRDLNNHFMAHEIILKDEEIDKAECIKKYMKEKYPKHISKSVHPKYPNVNLDQLANYLIHTFSACSCPNDLIIKIEKLNDKIKKELETNFELLDAANKKNGFFLGYLFVKSEIDNRRRKIPKTVRDKLWSKSFFDNLSGKCYVCEVDVNYHNFHAGHKISVKNGGSDSLTNLEILCSCCNLSMGTQNLIEFKKKYFS